MYLLIFEDEGDLLQHRPSLLLRAGAESTCWIGIHVFLWHNHKNTITPCICHGYVHIQGEYMHRTGWIWKESRILFLDPRMQHVGWGIYIYINHPYILSVFLLCLYWWMVDWCVKLVEFSSTVESTERISEIWFREPFPPWGVLRFRVRVRFTYG